VKKRWVFCDGFRVKKNRGKTPFWYGRMRIYIGGFIVLKLGSGFMAKNRPTSEQYIFIFILQLNAID